MSTRKFPLCLFWVLVIILGFTIPFSLPVFAEIPNFNTEAEARITSMGQDPTAEPFTLSGDYSNGFFLATNGTPTQEYWLYLKNPSGNLNNGNYGLYYVPGESTVSTAQLQSYYDNRHSQGLLPDPYYTYLENASTGTIPYSFAILKVSGSSYSLLDACRYYLNGVEKPFAIPADFLDGIFVVRGSVLSGADSGTVTFKLTITRFSFSEGGCQAGLTGIGGPEPSTYYDLSYDNTNGYTLKTNNVATNEYWLKFKSPTVTNTLTSTMFGLFLQADQAQKNSLLAYYNARKENGLLPDNYYNYLVAATNGASPFAYIDGSTLQLVDGARYNITSNKLPMAIPGDFPPGTYTVQGTVSDIYGNSISVTFKLTIARFPEVWVDDDWATKNLGEDLGGGKVFGWNAFATIQEAIDAVSNGGTVNVFPGTYNKDEANDRDYLNGGQGIYDFNIFVDKPLTIQGVKADGTPVTSLNDISAYLIPMRDTPSGNLSTIFVQADNVTISGLDITAYIDPDYNFKTISVIGNNVTIKDCKIHARDQVSCIYMYDPRYNPTTDTSYLTSYTIQGNLLDAGGIEAAGIRISSGPGWTGDVSSRLISNNTFQEGSYGIQFVGPGGDPWDYYPVGAATITGNTFSGQDRGSVVAWGKYKDAQGYGNIDWDHVLSQNTFDKAVVVRAPDNTIRYYDFSYTDPNGVHNFYFIRGIYSGIQRYPINRVAQPGDTVVVKPGIYKESQVLIDKPLTLQGAGIDQSIIEGATPTISTVGQVRITAPGNVTVTGFTIRKASGPPIEDNGDNALNVGIYARSSTEGVTYTISNVKIIGTNNPNDEEDYGIYSYGGKESLIFTNSSISQTGSNPILMERHRGPTEISNNVLDAGCYGVNPIFYITYGGLDITTLQKVCGNTIDVSTGTGTGNVTGISFMGAYTINDTDLGDGKFTNVLVENNTINGLDVGNRGISLYNDDYGDGTGGEISNAIIRNNTITGTGSPTTNCFGIRLAGYVTNSTISGNTISGANIGILLTTASHSGSVTPTGITVNLNNLNGNVDYGIKWDGQTTLEAEYNWWGDIYGPNHSDRVYGNVDYDPWLSQQVNPDSPPSIPTSKIQITTTSCPTGALGLDYLLNLSCTGNTGDVTWYVSTTSTTLPLGLTLGTNGTISGTPAEWGTFEVEFTVTDSVQATSKTLTVRILQFALEITEVKILDMSGTPTDHFFSGGFYQVEVTIKNDTDFQIPSGMIVMRSDFSNIPVNIGTMNFNNLAVGETRLVGTVGFNLPSSGYTGTWEVNVLGWSKWASQGGTPWALLKPASFVVGTQ